MSFRRVRRVLGVGAVAAAAIVGGALPPFGLPAAHAALGAGGEYHPVTPARVLDTRQPGSSPTGVRGFGASNAFTVQITGANTIAGVPSGVPASDVLGVVATITVAGTNRSGYLTAYPAGSALPNASNVNFLAGADASNLALLRPGANGQVTIDLETDGSAPAAGGSAHVLIDVVGWFSTSSSVSRGSRLVSLAPGRVLDTRTGVGAALGPVGPGVDIALKIRGANATAPERAGYIPADPNVSGVILNITATGASADTFVSVQPDAFSGFPSTSSVNSRAGQTKANLVMVPVGADGNIHLFNAYGNVHLLADVVGYYLNGVADESRAGRVVPISSPFRVIDTRGGARPGKLGSGQEEPWDFNAFEQTVTLAGVPVGDIDSLMMNFTAADLSFPYSVGRDETYLSVYPGGTALPGSSTVNLRPDQKAVPNFAVATLSGDNRLNVYQDNGFVHYIADVAAVVLK